jgi:hypothetical protein
MKPTAEFSRKEQKSIVTTIGLKDGEALHHLMRIKTLSMEPSETMHSLTMKKCHYKSSTNFFKLQRRREIKVLVKNASVTLVLVALSSVQPMGHS